MDAPAGWYPQPDGQQRYWDGQQWTENFAPAGTETTTPDIQGPPTDDKTMRPWFKKKRIIIPAAALLLLVIVSVSQQSAQTAARDKVAAVASQKAATQAAADKVVADQAAVVADQVAADKAAADQAVIDKAAADKAAADKVVADKQAAADKAAADKKASADKAAADKKASADKAAAANAEAEKAAHPTIEDGQWEVGVDVPAGVYKVTAAVDPAAMCYWSITETGNPDNIISNDIVNGGKPTVTIQKGQDFTTNDCGTWAKR